MSNYTTYQTALKLKEAGFPQPTPEFGQVWYGETGTPYLVYNILNGRSFFIEAAQQSQGWAPIIAFQRTMIFAPTATDILAQLPQGLGIINLGKYSFAVEFTATEYIRDKNPHEAAAAAWLKVHELQAETDYDLPY